MVLARKLKVMFKCEGGFIMSKRQMVTVNDDIRWQFAKNTCGADGLLATAEVFEDHGYEIVEWDDNQEASDGTMIFKLGDEEKK
jgi:hypothetical protein